MKRSLRQGDQTLEYEFTPKRVKNINLRVRGDGTVAVSAPRWVTREQVEAFLIARWDWIDAALQRRAQRTQPAFGWKDGEPFHLLGNLVMVKRVGGTRADATLSDDTLILVLPDPYDDAKAAAVGEKWYDRFCRRQLALLDEQVWNRFRYKGTARPLLRLRWMTSRWGSCHPCQQYITLNKRLFALPCELGEYVLFHEYCHLLHPDHQAGFYALLEEFVPQRRQCDQLLKSGSFRFIR